MGVHIQQHPTRENDDLVHMSSTASEKDEAAVQVENGGIDPNNNENVVHKEEFYAGNSLIAKLHRITGRWGVEERGIERLPSDERDARRPMNVGITVSAPPFQSLAFLQVVWVWFPKKAAANYLRCCMMTVVFHQHDLRFSDPRRLTRCCLRTGFRRCGDSHHSI